jgi:streptogrisin B
MTPRLFAAAAVLAIATALSAHAAPAHAAPLTVSPGDRIDTPNTCTIAYTYTGRNKHTYAITAGHCANGKPVRDQRSGAAGIFVASVVDPPRTGGPDYGLIDFGPHAMAVGFIGNRPVATNDYPPPRPGQTACRAGITTGQQCGTIAAAYGDHQYLTTGMRPSRGGDSGAPVWTIAGDGHAQIIGIWLGGRTTGDGQDFGRFAALSSAVATLGVAAAD